MVELARALRLMDSRRVVWLLVAISLCVQSLWVPLHLGLADHHHPGSALSHSHGHDAHGHGAHGHDAHEAGSPLGAHGQRLVGQDARDRSETLSSEFAPAELASSPHTRADEHSHHPAADHQAPSIVSQVSVPFSLAPPLATEASALSDALLVARLLPRAPPEPLCTRSAGPLQPRAPPLA